MDVEIHYKSAGNYNSGCKLKKKFCHSAHIAYNGYAVKGQKTVNTEEKKGLEGELEVSLLLVWTVKSLGSLM